MNILKVITLSSFFLVTTNAFSGEMKNEKMAGKMENDKMEMKGQMQMAGKMENGKMEMKGQMQKNADDNFAASDTNKDGKLDKKEHAAFHNMMKPSTMNKKSPSSEEIFAMQDTNKDGFVTKDEMKQDHQMAMKNHEMKK